MAAKVSLSKAWDEARGILRRDGRLIVTVALALLVLPSTIQAMVTPAAPPGELPAPGPWIFVALVALAIGVIGQLSLIRLAIGPATSVGEAISHGVRRAPSYLAALLIWLAPLAAALVLLMGAMAQPASRTFAALALLAVLLAMIFVAVRFVLAVGVASAESPGPLQILQRSWALTAGNWWRLFAFAALFLIVALCVMIAAAAVFGLLATLLFGAPNATNLSGLIVVLATQLAVGAVTAVFMVMVARIYVQLSGRGSASVPKSGI